MFTIIKNIFLPSFCYKFDIHLGLVDLNYSDELNQKLNALGTYIVRNNSDGYQFIIKTSRLLNAFPGVEGVSYPFIITSSRLLNRFRIGKALITISNKEKDKFNIEIKFKTQKTVFFIVASLISIFMLSRIYVEQEDIINKLVMILGTFISGHLYFWASLIAHIQQIKDFFGDLGRK